MDEEPAKHALDPERAVEEQRSRSKPELPPPVIDTRPYRWAIGIFGIALVIVLSVVQLASHGIKSTGIAPGSRLFYFAAPLAATNLQGDANMKPPCTLAKHDPRALNICLIAHKRPLVLAFFVTGSGNCKHEVDTLQTVSRQFPPSAVQFAAIAVGTSHSDTEALVRSHHWTIPVAYDSDNAVGQVYGVEFCPMVELAYRGGIVKSRLIGDKWLAPAALAAQVRSLLASHPTK
jgi:peroxiredoxin